LTSEVGAEYNTSVRERGFIAAEIRELLADKLADTEGVVMALAQCSALQLKHAKSGVLYDGGGLEFHVAETCVRAVLRFTPSAGQRRAMGLGSLDRSSTQATGRSLADVRRRAQEARSLLERGIDPIEERKSQRSAVKRAEAERKAEYFRQVPIAHPSRQIAMCLVSFSDVASSLSPVTSASFTGRPATPLTAESRHIGANGALCRVSRKKTN